MNSKYKIILAIMVICIFAAPSSDAYKKVKVFLPEIPIYNLEGAQTIAILDFHTDFYDTRHFGRYMADRMIDLTLTYNRGITKVDKGLFKSPIDGVCLIDGINTRCLTVVERLQIETLLYEQNIYNMGLVQDNDLSRIGQLLGVDVMVFGDLKLEYIDKPKEETKTVEEKKKKVKISERCIERTVTVTANIRLVNVVQGTIIDNDRKVETLTDKACGNDINKLRSVDSMFEECMDKISLRFVNLFSPWYQLYVYDLEKIKNKAIKDQAEEAAEAAEDLNMIKAYSIYRELLEEDPYNPKLHYNIGVLYEATGNFRMACEMYQSAINLKHEKKYQTAFLRAEGFDDVAPYFASVNMDFTPLNLDEAVTYNNSTREFITVKGSPDKRYSIYEQPNENSPIVASVPGEIRLEVISKEKDWTLVKLFWGKIGYIRSKEVKD